RGARVERGSVLCDGEAEAGAAHFAAAGAVYAIEALEDTVEFGRGDADAVVDPLHRHGLALGDGADGDGAALGGVLDGVVDQVGDGAVEIIGVAEDARE